MMGKPTWAETFLRKRPQYREHCDLLVRPPTFCEVVAEWPEAAHESALKTGERYLARNAHDGTRGLTMLALYVISRRAGSTHDLAMMLVCNQPPGIETTDTFWAGRQRFDQVYGEQFANTIKANFAKQGINLKNGDEYMPELCRPEYSVANPDPEAIVPFGNARGYIKRLCQQRGWECNGAVKTKHREPIKDPHAPENCVKIADELVEQKAIELATKNPELRKKTKRELREMVRDKHGDSR